jgi:hypothetical protein
MLYHLLRCSVLHTHTFSAVQKDYLTLKMEATRPFKHPELHHIPQEPNNQQHPWQNLKSHNSNSCCLSQLPTPVIPRPANQLVSFTLTVIAYITVLLVTFIETLITYFQLILHSHLPIPWPHTPHLTYLTILYLTATFTSPYPLTTHTTSHYPISDRYIHISLSPDHTHHISLSYIWPLPSSSVYFTTYHNTSLLMFRYRLKPSFYVNTVYKCFVRVLFGTVANLQKSTIP